MTPIITNIYQPPNWLDPLDWQQVFGRAGRLEVDLGCGKGAFLLWAAQTRPESNFLGVDRLLTRLRKVDKRVRRCDLPNVRLVRIEASYLIGRLVPDESVAVYHIYFPDPWPKRRHHRRRLFNAAFVNDLRRTLRAGGVVNVATDHEVYFQQIESMMAKCGLIRRMEVEALPEEARTDFELEFLAEGKRICRGRWARK